MIKQKGFVEVDNHPKKSAEWQKLETYLKDLSPKISIREKSIAAYLEGRQDRDTTLKQMMETGLTEREAVLIILNLIK